MYIICCFIIFVFLYVSFLCFGHYVFFFFFKQKTAYEMRISDWSSDVCSSDLLLPCLPSRASLPQASDSRSAGNCGRRARVSPGSAPSPLLRRGARGRHHPCRCGISRPPTRPAGPSSRELGGRSR